MKAIHHMSPIADFATPATLTAIAITTGAINRSETPYLPFLIRERAPTYSGRTITSTS